MILFRHSDPRFPFLWESTGQPAARWHDLGEGPVQYFADTPDGAWAELLRHEEITDEADLIGIERDLWAANIPDAMMPSQVPSLPSAEMQGGIRSYSACRAEARRLRAVGAHGLIAPSAALLPGGASGWRVERGTLVSGPQRDGAVVVLFGAQPDIVGWTAAYRGHPGPRLLPLVRPLSIG